MRQANVDELRRMGRIIYLDVKPEEVVRRLAGDTTRPLLQGENVDQRVRELMEQRGPVYEAAADIIVPVTGIENILEASYQTEIKNNINLYLVPTEEGEYLNIAFSNTGDYTYIRSEADENSEWVGKLYSDSAAVVLEYLDGKLSIHEGKEYQVMTNSPRYEYQLAINDYWKEVGGLQMLPGTNRSSDRFVRASFYIHAIPQTADAKIAVPSVLSVMRNVSVPFGINTPEKPHISSTRWRSVSDQKNKVYYFESTLTPNLFWLDLKKIDFSPKAGVKKLSLTKGEIYAGDAVKDLKDSQSFTFLFETPVM